MRATAAIADWSGWLDAWVAEGDEQKRAAEDAKRRGRQVSAGEAYVRAALYYHFAKYQSVEDEARYRAATDLSVAALRAGMPLLDATFERIEIPFEGSRIVANLRRPAGVARPPVVLLIPGLDSTKEELPRLEGTLLRRGLATATLDGPGQGEAGYDLPIRPDYEVPVRALLDVLAKRSDIDTARIGIAGLALGSYYSARAAAFEPRLRAVAGIGGPYTLDERNPRNLGKLMHSLKVKDPDEAHARAKRFTLAGVAEKIEQPYLVLHGAKDPTFPWQDAERKAREAKRGESVIYPDAGTACYGVYPIATAHLADWMREKLTA